MALNLPNQLTVFRLACVPVFMIFTYTDNVYTRLLALLIFIVAGITDLYDGYLARKYNMVTTLGTFLDPLADKLIVTAAFISFVEIPEVHVPAWMVVIIVARDFFMTGFRSLAASQNEVIPADEGGKFKTSLQNAAIVTTLSSLLISSALHSFWGISMSSFYASSGWRLEAARLLSWIPYWSVFIVTVFSLVTGVGYFLKFRYIFNKVS